MTAWTIDETKWPDRLHVEQAAEMAGVNHRTVRRWADEHPEIVAPKQLPPRVREALAIDRDRFVAFLKEAP